MPSPSRADHRASPPQIHIPRDYNAAHDLIERNLAGGRGGKVAYIDDAGSYTYGDLAERVNRCANALVDLGLRREERVLLCHLDTIEFPALTPGTYRVRVPQVPDATPSYVVVDWTDTDLRLSR